MSRVDEARRRAAELARESGVSPVMETAGVNSMAATEIRELSAEPFPLEMPGRRTAGPAVAPSTTAFAPVMEELPHSLPALPGVPKAGSLFQRIDSSLAEKVVIDSNTMAGSREEYRRLAAALHHAQAARGLKVVMIASAVPGEGKTLTAANLALTLSESYQRNVLLIDADLRRPTLHTIFRLDNREGLSDGLTATAERRLPARQVSTRLAILPAGQPTADPMAGLTSDRMSRLLDEARDVFDWIILDTPPVGLLSDANLLATMVDGAVLVVNAGTTPYTLVQRAIAAIGRERILGTVLNRAESHSDDRGYSQYSGYYGERRATT